jgi:hypothetical protein
MSMVRMSSLRSPTRTTTQCVSQFATNNERDILAFHNRWLAEQVLLRCMTGEVENRNDKEGEAEVEA